MNRNERWNTLVRSNLLGLDLQKLDEYCVMRKLSTKRTDARIRAQHCGERDEEEPGKWLILNCTWKSTMESCWWVLMAIIGPEQHLLHTKHSFASSKT